MILVQLAYSVDITLSCGSTLRRRITVGDGISRGHWYVYPAGFYKGGFITNVVDTARNFDVIQAGSWSPTNNPAQLTNITQMGGVFTTITSIMGSFNNVQLDQFTIGEGLRIEGGTAATPYTFEDARAIDEDTNFWGWWSSKNGQIVSKGKLYIGPEVGSTSTVFSSIAETVVFADERVADGFYEIQIVGSATTASFELVNISAASTTRRWTLNVSSSAHSFSDKNSVLSIADKIILSQNSSVTGSTYINCTRLFQSGAALNNVNVLDANTVAGEAFIIADDISLISDSTFNYSAGHAIELPPTITTPVTYSFSNNQFVGYLADNTSGSAIFNNTGGDVLINIVDGGNTPTIRNSTGSSTTVNAAVTFKLTGLQVDSEVRIYDSTTGAELAGTESSGTTFTYQYNYTSDRTVYIVIFHLDFVEIRLTDITLSSSDQSIPIQQRTDRVYNNPA